MNEIELNCRLACRAAEQLDELDYKDSTLKVSDVSNIIYKPTFHLL